MGVPPAGMSLERKDNDGDYTPDNCKWATQKEQQRNKSSNRLIEYNGETLCLSEWAERLGINLGTLHARLNKHGWSVEKAFRTKVR